MSQSIFAVLLVLSGQYRSEPDSKTAAAADGFVLPIHPGRI